MNRGAAVAVITYNGNLRYRLDLQIMKWRDRIILDPNILVGKPIIKETRIAVEFVVDLLGRGWTIEQILHEYDHLTPEDIQACLAYASEILKSERVYSMPTA